ncbi:MAG: type II restriction endonuclease [Patescibacteria group bacterium]|nr:type II restriction endonuclease [Patescibacteria group bacterium]MBU1730013.1 type II restriction endonuclease [Patescibacteria group bacterium]MBU1956531.1 type II restriction endonuclease [Patescibacteria group bacterium]MBU2010172.1 type II restriction endonuclease [Patescibacteria group bacterium]
MKNLSFYSDKLNYKTDDQVFDFFISNLQESISDWDFFVNWGKIKKNICSIETELNILNSLLGKEDLDNKLIELVEEYPKTRKVLPILIAVRNQKLKDMPILNMNNGLHVEIKDYVFDINIKINLKTKKELLRFFTESGLKNIFKDHNIKNLVDYCLGVEVGMDTNARKNRGGRSMEDIVENYLKDICKKNNYTYLSRVNAEKIRKNFGYNVPVDKSSRIYDFVVNNGKELFIIETNFYSGGGSKLKSTAGEYRNLFDVLNGKFKFFWITDGNGWKTAKKSLRETFNHNDYLFNLAMLRKGVLENLLK